MRSIRRFLVVVVLAVITLISFMAALHGYRSSMQRAEELFDAQLADIAAVLVTVSGAPAPAAAVADSDSIVFQIWHDRQLLLASPDAPDTPMAPFEAGYSDVNFSGYRWRAFSRYVPASANWLMVAERTDMRFVLAENVIVAAVLPIVLGLPVQGLLIWLIVGRGLRPLRDLAQEMSAKRSDDLSPLADTQPPLELATLVGSINGLLERLAQAFEREQRFAADAAHELRTPISVIKVQLHNLQRQHGPEPALIDMAAAVDRMGHSIEQLLALYRTSPQQFAASFAKVDLTGLAREVIADLYPTIDARSQHVELLGGPAWLSGDAFALRTLLRNLIDNAGKYSGAGSEIRVVTAVVESAVTLTVEDSGPGVPEIEYRRLFERFYRVGGDRHVSGMTGVGLGLAIVQHIADMHGARVRVGRSSFASGLAVTVEFPERRAGEATDAS